MLRDRSRVPLKDWRKAVDRVCERATGLISLFTAGCLPDQLVRHFSPLTGLTVHKVNSPS